MWFNLEKPNLVW